MKGSVLLNPNYQSLSIRNAKVHKINPLIAQDQKYLYFKGLEQYDTLKSTKWDDKVIINCTYLRQYKIILALCQNYRIYVLTENLEEITSITGWQSKYNLAFEYIQEYGMFLMIGAQSIEMVKVRIDTNIKKTKFISSMKFSLKKLFSSPVVSKATIPWNKGYNLNAQLNFLYVWSPQGIAFLTLSNLEVLSQSLSLTKKQNPITYCYYNSYYKYTITGTNNGQIRVWRLPLSKLFTHENILIHVFEYHSKAISQIINCKNNQKIILSSGEDLNICYWSLETFQMLRKFDLFGIYNQIYVKNIHQAFVTKDGQLGQINFGQSLQFITQVNSSILMIDKSQISQENGSLVLTLQENFGMVMQTQPILHGKDINKMQIKNIYPPLKVKSIKQIISSPFVPNQYYLLAQNGQLFKVIVPSFGKQYQGISSKIQQMYNVPIIMDKQKHPLNQEPNCIEFLKLLPPQFDSQIRQVEQKQGKSHRSERNNHKQLSVSKAIQKYQNQRLLLIGCSRGSIIFVSTKNMNKIYCRLTYHRQKVTFVQCIQQFKNDQFNPMNGYLASYCAQNYLKISQFDHNKLTSQCILTYFAGQQLKFIRSFQTFFILVFMKSQFQISQINSISDNKQLYCQRSNNAQIHEGQIFSIDYQQNYKLILTAGSDNKIKIWTVKKILIYDIILGDGLSYANFLSHKIQKNKQINQQKKQTFNNKKKAVQKEIENQVQLSQVQKKLRIIMSKPRPVPVKFDLLISQSNKLQVFNNIPLAFRPKQIDQINQAQSNEGYNKIALKDIFQNYSQERNKNNSISKINMNLSKKRSLQNISSSFKKQKINSLQNLQQSPVKNSKQVQKLNNSKLQVNNYQQNIQRSRIYSQPSFQQNLKESRNQNLSKSLCKKQLQPLIIKNKTKRQQKMKTQASIGSLNKSSLQKDPFISLSSIEQTKKHLKQISQLKKRIYMNRPILPIIKNKKQDIFDQFMKQKLLHKNVLTRRDITLNRIIMKNIIKEHFQTQSKFSALKLDY